MACLHDIGHKSRECVRECICLISPPPLLQLTILQSETKSLFISFFISVSFSYSSNILPQGLCFSPFIKDEKGLAQLFLHFSKHTKLTFRFLPLTPSFNDSMIYIFVSIFFFHLVSPIALVSFVSPSIHVGSSLFYHVFSLLFYLSLHFLDLGLGQRLGHHTQRSYRCA